MEILRTRLLVAFVFYLINSHRLIQWSQLWLQKKRHLFKARNARSGTIKIKNPIVNEFSKKKNIHYFVRIHPADKCENYSLGFYGSFDKDLDHCKTIVGHTSSMLFMYQATGHFVLKLKSDVEFFNLDRNMLFSDLSELEKKINNPVIGEKVIKYISNESLKKSPKLSLQ